MSVLSMTAHGRKSEEQTKSEKELKEVEKRLGRIERRLNSLTQEVQVIRRGK